MRASIRDDEDRRIRCLTVESGGMRGFEIGDVLRLLADELSDSEEWVSAVNLDHELQYVEVYLESEK